MKILMIAAEAFPFAKTGGLADTVSSLAIALHKNGHDVRILIPRYYSIDRKTLELLEEPMGVSVGASEVWTAVYKTKMPEIKNNKTLPVYFIDHENSFGRDGIYGTPLEPDFDDNPFRFSLLCNSAFQLCKKLNWYPDILHVHDWSTALVPALLKFYHRKGSFTHTASVLTVHNLAYQGVYPTYHYPKTGMNWSEFYSGGFEDWDHMNFLKSGLVSADVISTVSPKYALEIQQPQYGFRMDSILAHRKKDLFGILNGINTDEWNPTTDNKIVANYSIQTMHEKTKNKTALQKRMGLVKDSSIPIVGIIMRLVDQKGISELFAPTYGSAFAMCVDFNMQMIVLGSGEKWCEDELINLSSKLPNFASYIGYDNELSHLIEAGSDFFLMPSKYEPCGLNQMYSLLYGTLPIVRNTGGFADTVEQYNEKTGEGTGFLFNNLSPQSIYDTVGWAMYTWYNKKEDIEKMKIKAMNNNFSWDSSVKKYEHVYNYALKKL
ncbi:MAG TPA: glycogen/starch synthase [Treponemataceae bacterium]|nr:glycogen/starch synthase [Treponemataceae bacterium]